jgi:hypothetical protein
MEGTAMTYTLAKDRPYLKMSQYLTARMEELGLEVMIGKTLGQDHPACVGVGGRYRELIEVWQRAGMTIPLPNDFREFEQGVSRLLYPNWREYEEARRLAPYNPHY